MIKSYKTTLTGILAAVAAVATAFVAQFDTDPLTTPDWALVASSVMAGIGLIFARDWNVTSEDEGLKK
jgi:hypothetical protein